MNYLAQTVVSMCCITGTTPSQTDGFVGCIRKLQVNGKVHNLKKASELAQEVVPGCSGHCSVTPCLFGGKCIEGYKDFSCNCSVTHAEGENCAKGMFEKGAL